MRKYSTTELLTTFLFMLFVVSALLVGKGPIYKNVFVISLSCFISLKGRIKLESKSEETKWSGRALILISISIVSFLFMKSNNSARNISLVCLIVAIVIYLIIWSKNASKNVFSCTLWLLFIPTITPVFIVLFINNIIKLQLIYMILIFFTLYCTMWIIMAIYGQLQTTRQAISWSGFAAVILLMFLIFIAQIFAPIIMQNDASTTKFITNSLAYLGYTYKDLVNIFIYVATFPGIILAGISYIITSGRKSIKVIN